METKTEMRTLSKRILLTAAQAERLKQLLNGSTRQLDELQRIARRVVSDVAENKKLLEQIQKLTRSR